MAETFASMLRLSLKMALSKVRLNFRRLGLSEEERGRIADDTIAELRRYGDYSFLDDEVRPRHPGPTWMNGKPPEES
jgi:hypothetical protein